VQKITTLVLISLVVGCGPVTATTAPAQKAGAIDAAAAAAAAVVQAPMRGGMGDHGVFYAGVRLEVLVGPVYDGWCSGFAGPFAAEFKKSSGRAPSKGLTAAAAATTWDVTLRGIFPGLGEKELQKLLQDPTDPRWVEWQKKVPEQGRRILDSITKLKVKVTQFPELAYEE
jgi:hypothetical protein